MKLLPGVRCINETSAIKRVLILLSACNKQLLNIGIERRDLDYDLAMTGLNLGQHPPCCLDGLAGTHTLKSRYKNAVSKFLCRKARWKRWSSFTRLFPAM